MYKRILLIAILIYMHLTNSMNTKKVNPSTINDSRILIIKANKDDWSNIKKLIEQLDTPYESFSTHQSLERKTLVEKQKKDWLAVLRCNPNNIKNLTYNLNCAANAGVVLSNDDIMSLSFNQDFLQKSIEEPSPDLLQALLRHQPIISDKLIENVKHLYSEHQDCYYSFLLQLLHKSQSNNYLSDKN